MYANCSDAAIIPLKHLHLRATNEWIMRRMGEYHSRELEKQNAEASYTFNPSLKIFQRIVLLLIRRARINFLPFVARITQFTFYRTLSPSLSLRILTSYFAVFSLLCRFNHNFWGYLGGTANVVEMDRRIRFAAGEKEGRGGLKFTAGGQRSGCMAGCQLFSEFCQFLSVASTSLA